MCNEDGWVQSSDQPTGRLALVFELMDMNIYEFIQRQYNHVAEESIKNYMYQLMKGFSHLTCTNVHIL
jgi:renal tumor antigen